MGFFFPLLFLSFTTCGVLRARVHVSPKLSENVSIKMCVYRDTNAALLSLMSWRFARSDVFHVSVCIINDDVSAKQHNTDLARVA